MKTVTDCINFEMLEDQRDHLLRLIVKVESGLVTNVDDDEQLAIEGTINLFDSLLDEHEDTKHHENLR